MYRNLKITYQTSVGTDITYAQKVTFNNGFLVVWYSDSAKAHISFDIIISIEADNRFYKEGF